jgi:hypothetical protein
MRIKIIILLIGLLILPLQTKASLLFTDGGSEKVDHGNTGTDPTISTFYAWVYPTSCTAQRSIIRKIDPSLLGNYALATAVTCGIRFTVDYATTDADARGQNNDFTINNWWFVAVTFDGVTAPKLYIGNLTTPVHEIASYSISTAPSGARVTDGGARTIIGNLDNGGVVNAGFQGRIAVANFIQGSVLSLGQLKQHQFNPHAEAGSRIFTWYGFNGTGTQPDWSGNKNNGTVTGAKIAPNVPIAAPFGFMGEGGDGGEVAYNPFNMESLIALRDRLDTSSFAIVKRLKFYF